MDYYTVKNVNELILKCKAILESSYGDRLAGLVVFGSSARRTADADSDIDILVLFNGTFDYFAELRNLVDLLYPIQLESERLLSVKPAGIEEYESGRLQLYRNAQREGIQF